MVDHLFQIVYSRFLPVGAIINERKTTIILSIRGITMYQICDKRENFALQALHTARFGLNKAKCKSKTNLEFIKIENKNSGN